MNQLPEANPFLKGALLMAGALSIMATPTISPALPEMLAHFGALGYSSTSVKLALTLPALFIALGAPWAGAISDRYGPGRLLLGSTVLYAFSGTSGFYLSSFPLILLGRALLGLSVAGILTTSTALIGSSFSGERRNRFLGLQTAWMGFGGVIFLNLGGVLAGHSWQSPFAIYGLAILLIPLLKWGLPSIASQRPQPSKKVDASKAASAPLTPTLVAYGLAFVAMAMFYLVPVQVPFLLRSMHIDSAFLAGLSVSAATLAGGFASLSYARIRRYFEPSGMFAVSYVLMGMGLLTLGLSQGFATILLGTAGVGAGMGLMLPALNHYLLETVPAEIRGRSLGLLSMHLFLGQFLSPMFTDGVASHIGLAPTFVAGAAVLFVLPVLTLLAKLKMTPRPQGTPP